MAATALSFSSFPPQPSSSLSVYGAEHHHHHHHHSSNISRGISHPNEQHHNLNHLSSPPQLSRPSHTCPSCSRPFSRAEHLERHLATHLPSNSSKCFVCQSCLKGFTRKDVLKRHIRAVHERKRSDIRRSRRRSCKRCAGFKIKCTGIGRTLNTDGTGTADEACEACKKRGVECVYDFRATAPERPSTENSSPQDSYAYDDYSESDPSRRGSAESTDDSKNLHNGYSSEPTTPSPQSISISSILHLTDLPSHSNRRPLDSDQCPRTTTDEDRRTSAAFQNLLSSPTSSSSNYQSSSSTHNHGQEIKTPTSATSSLPVSFLVNGSTTSNKETLPERTWVHSRTVVVARNDLSIGTRPRAASDAALHNHHHGNGGDNYARRDTMGSTSMRHNVISSIEYDRTGQPGRLETSLSRPQSSHYSTFSPSYDVQNSAPPLPPPPPPPPPLSTPTKITSLNTEPQSMSKPLYSNQSSPVLDQGHSDAAPRPTYYRTQTSSSEVISSSNTSKTEVSTIKPTPISEYRPTAIFQNTYPHAPRSSAPQHQQAGQWVWQPAGTSEHDLPQRVTLPPLRHLLDECDSGSPSGSK